MLDVEIWEFASIVPEQPQNKDHEDYISSGSLTPQILTNPVSTV